MNVVIVEDELHTSQMLCEIIERNEGFVVTKRLESVVEAVPYLADNLDTIDLLFFDIQLADGKSFEILKHVDITVPVIFCTAYEEFSMEAIQNNGINYILKPFRESEIITALEKYKKLFAGNGHTKTAAVQLQQIGAPSYQQNFLTQFRGQTLIKNIHEVALFCIEYETVYLYTLKGERFPIYKKIDYLESVCDPVMFFRINRKMLVHKTAIKAIEPIENRKVALILPIKTTFSPIVSRLKVSSFKKWLING